ncbi:MAG: cupin domain-containing protein [Rubrivivax sp.]|nr:cupin domain-containing protein [Rubrivivax sp.]MBK7263923.1 cupin domain-containing protein [Rubrivivax sp.]MBK8525799.1 cupin domain-containing protein [Rubrivivax sp.]
MQFRRVVTGHDANSKAVFASDEVIAPRVVPGINFEFVRLWGADKPADFPDSGGEPTYRTYFPPADGFRFGIFTIPAARTMALTSEERRNSLHEMERLLPGLAAHMEPSTPGMHTSDSIDFGYVISGSIWLELDDGSAKELRAGDTYVQNGTRHAWRNRSSEPCRVLVALVGANRQPSGVSVAQSLGVRE